MKVDFHCHSTASDGTLAPKDLAEKARDFDVFSLTDHDNCDGVAQCAQAAKGYNKFVPGIELSIDAGEGFDKFHLLGFGFDPEHPTLKAFLERILKGRNERNDAILANFAKIGIHIDPADIAQYANGDVLARPHFARWLVNHGHASDIKTAFDKYLLPYSPAESRCYETRYHPSQEESFNVIHSAGGLCVMAHPKYWCDSWRVQGVDYAHAQRGLSQLKEIGLDGVEALYFSNTAEENVEFVRIATKLGYLKTAGSDFHGTNKPTVPLGMEVSAEYISPFLEALNLV